MTTVACNREYMASDSLLLAPGDPKSQGKKIWEYRGCLIGVAGDYTQCRQFLKWYMTSSHKKKAKRVPEDMEEVSALILTKTGRIFAYSGTIEPYEVLDPFMAIGSGASCAMGAMFMSADPTLAVKIASCVDPGTGGKVKTLTIKKRGQDNGRP